MSVSKKRLHTKRTTLHFFVRNGERSPLLLETNNTLRVVTQTYFNSEHTIDFGQHDSGFGRLDCKPLWAPRSTVVSHLRLETWWNQSCPKGHSFQKCTNVSWVNSKLLALVYRKYNKSTAWERKHTCHGTTLHPPFKTQCATNSCYGNNKHLMFLKWRPELKKKKNYN